jgi:hypothetical protein
MRAHTAASVDALRRAGIPQRHFHQRSIDCFDYLDALADECGAPRCAQAPRQMARALLAEMQQNPGDLRDRALPHFGPTVVPPESIRATQR